MPQGERIPEQTRQRIREMVASGISVRKISKELSVSKTTVHRLGAGVQRPEPKTIRTQKKDLQVGWEEEWNRATEKLNRYFGWNRL